MPDDRVPVNLLEDEVEVGPTKEEDPGEEEPGAVTTMNPPHRRRHQADGLPVKSLEA